MEPDSGAAGPGRPARRLATQLYDAIQALSLDVETVPGGHCGAGTTYAAPLDYLRISAGY